MSKAYRDLRDPSSAHVVKLAGVLLPFGEDGLLRKPSAEQLETMRANGLRTERFVEVDVPEPKPAAAPAPKRPAEPRPAKEDGSALDETPKEKA